MIITTIVKENDLVMATLHIHRKDGFEDLTWSLVAIEFEQFVYTFKPDYVVGNKPSNYIIDASVRLTPMLDKAVFVIAGNPGQTIDLATLCDLRLLGPIHTSSLERIKDGHQPTITVEKGEYLFSWDNGNLVASLSTAGNTIELSMRGKTCIDTDKHWYFCEHTNTMVMRTDKGSYYLCLTNPADFNAAINIGTVLNREALNKLAVAAEKDLNK